MAKSLKFYPRLATIVVLFLPTVSCHLDDKKNDLSETKSDFYFDKVMEAHFQQGSEIEQQYLDSALIYNPFNSRVLFEKSAWQIKIGSYSNYFQYMNKAVELNPETYLGWRGAIKLHYLRDYEGAINDLIEFNKLYPNVADNATRGESTNYLIGIAQMGLTNFKKAISYFNKCISVASSKNQLEYLDPYIFVHKAYCHIKLNEFDKAHLELNQVFDNYEKCAEAHYLLGVIFIEESEWDMACKALKTAQVNYNSGYYLNDPYREVHNQLYLIDINNLIIKYCNGSIN